MSDHLLTFANQIVAMAIAYAPHLLLALLTLWIGFRLASFGIRAVNRALTLRRVDPTLATFLLSLISIGLKVLILISVAMMVGIQMTSFIAVIGAATLAVGMSLQGSLSNFAGGMLILFLKPFRVGDDIEGMTQRGIVEKIEMFNTTLRREDGTKVFLPNGALSNCVIVNHSFKRPGAPVTAGA